MKYSKSKKSKKVKSTLYITRDKREKIRQSGLSIEAYINQQFELQENFNIANWKNGFFKINYFRIGLFRAETINSIINYIDDEKVCELGKKIGEKLRRIVDNGIMKILRDENLNRRIIEQQNIFTGWGLYTLEENMIIVTTPIFTRPYFLQGYLEGLLNLKLTILESVPDRFVYKIIP